MQKKLHSPKKLSFALSVIAIILFFIAYLPVLKMLSTMWIDSDDYGHAFIVLPIIIYMLWKNKDRLIISSTTGTYFSFLVLLSSGILYLFSLMTQVQTLIFISFYFTIVSTLFFLGGANLIKTSFMPLIILGLLLPISSQAYVQLTSPLQLLVSQITVKLIKLFNIPILRDGNIINIPGKSFEVVEACSGLRSLLTLVTLSMVIAHFWINFIASKVVFIAISIPTAIMINILRLSIIILVFYFLEVDLSQGLLHEIIGIILFVFALSMLFTSLRFLKWFKK